MKDNGLICEVGWVVKVVNDDSREERGRRLTYPHRLRGNKAEIISVAQQHSFNRTRCIYPLKHLSSTQNGQRYAHYLRRP